MSGTGYIARRYQARDVLAEVKGDHETITNVCTMVWGAVPDSLRADPEKPDEEGIWKMHLGGADWFIVSRA